VFRKILVANRGEIALRVIRTCRELGIRTVAVYSDADRWAGYVAQADEAYRLGPAPSRESYLRVDALLEIARRSGAQAVHPGYGFLSENADFAEACAAAGLVFIGPKPPALRALGNKIAARRAAEALGIPVVPGLSEPADESHARAFAARHGYPILLKAAGGGGGKGMRVVREEADLARSLREASREAAQSFGDPTIFLERYVPRPRHVEIQIFGDGRGRVVHLGERDCSIQRRHQKLLEESPSPAVDAALCERMGRTACELARSVGYENAGTCEFLLDEDGRFYFLEVNARLQVEHPVTEMITGLDLVALQIRIAAGEAVPLEDVPRRGHAIEMRICAEDPARRFAPATGTVTSVRLPAGPFVRVDADLAPGMPVPVYYDSLLAKLICWGPDRDAVRARARRALDEFVVTGVPTTLPFHRRLLDDPRFRSGRIHTRFVEEEFPPQEETADRAEDAACLAAVLECARRAAAAPPSSADGRDRSLSAWKLAFRENGA
jgi:acetyl-CoA carboxylase biotin carboxylase subunit